MIDGSRSDKVLKLSSCEGAVPVGLGISLGEVLVGNKPVEMSVASIGAETVSGGAMAAVVVPLTAFIRFSLAAFHGNSGLTKDFALV